jgi:hypothetical protein
VRLLRRGIDVVGREDLVGKQPISLSKYRTGIALLARGAEDPEGLRTARRLFKLDRSG